MRNLFLASSFCHVAPYLVDFYAGNLAGKTITFIPTASMVEEYRQYVENDKQALEALGMQIDELHIDRADEAHIALTLAKNDFIYVSGGNTYYLLQVLRASKADQLLTEQILAGKLYIGASAGSMILAPDIDYIQFVDDKSKAPRLSDTKGLGLLDYYPLPHFGEEPFTALINKTWETFRHDHKLVPINNTQVIVVRNNQNQIIGQ